MAIKLKFQIVREGTEYESYRISFPKALVEEHDLRDKTFELQIKNGKVILTPMNEKKK